MVPRPAYAAAPRRPDAAAARVHGKTYVARERFPRCGEGGVYLNVDS